MNHGIKTNMLDFRFGQNRVLLLKAGKKIIFAIDFKYFIALRLGCYFFITVEILAITSVITN